LCFNGNPISNSDEDGDDAEDVNEDDPGDGFKRFKDGSYQKISNEGGNVYDVIYDSNIKSLFSSREGEVLYQNPITSMKFNSAYNDDGELYSAIMSSERISPGVWKNTNFPGEKGLESIDLTDFIPSKALLKVGVKAVFSVVIRKATVNTVERKIEKVVLKDILKKAGRKGSEQTRKQIDGIVERFEAKGWKQTAGGKLKEKYLKPLEKGSKKGGSYTDATFAKGKKRIDINTTDKGKYNGMSKREFINKNRIIKQLKRDDKINGTQSKIITVPKG
jgi:hypothetical protein